MFFFYERLVREYREILTGYQSPPGKRENYGIKVIARELLPKAANLKLLRVGDIRARLGCSGGRKQLCFVSQLRYEVQISA
jgi:hypothetical protein